MKRCTKNKLLEEVRNLQDICSSILTDPVYQTQLDELGYNPDLHQSQLKEYELILQNQDPDNQRLKELERDMQFGNQILLSYQESGILQKANSNISWISVNKTQPIQWKKITKDLTNYVKSNPVKTGIALGAVVASLFMFGLSGLGNDKISDDSVTEYLSKFDPMPVASANEQDHWELYMEYENLTYVPGEILQPGRFFLSNVDEFNFVYDEDHVIRSMEEVALQEVKPALKPDGSFGEVNMCPEEFCLALAYNYNKKFNATTLKALGVSLDEDDEPEKYCLVLGLDKSRDNFNYPWLALPPGPFLNSYDEEIAFGFTYATVTTPGKEIIESEISQERFFCYYPEETVKPTNRLMNMSEMESMIGHPRSDFVDGIDRSAVPQNTQTVQTQSSSSEESQATNEPAKQSPSIGTLTGLSIIGGVSYFKRKFRL